MTTPGMIVERSYTCSFTNTCRKNETPSDYHCCHQQGAKHLLKNSDFWDILDINLQNGHCLEGCLAFCQCQLFMLNQYSTNGELNQEDTADITGNSGSPVTTHASHLLSCSSP